MHQTEHSADTFFHIICKNYGINLEYIELENPNEKNYDGGLRELFYQNSNYTELLKLALHNFKPNTIYRLQDEFFNKYITFLHPDIVPETVVVLGPYRTDDLDLNKLYKDTVKNSISSVSYTTFKSIYQNIPWISNEIFLLTIATSYGEIIWNGLENFSLEQLNYTDLSSLQFNKVFPVNDPNTPINDINNIECSYLTENELLQAIATGNSHIAELQLEKLKKQASRKYLKPTLEESRSYAQVLNTLFRKTVEHVGVPAYFISEVFDNLSYQIELLPSVSRLPALQQDLIAKYCKLVTDYATTNYSPLIKKVVSYIHMNLANDLGLTTIANLFHIDKKYLSATFHENVGITLTEYVQKKRIEHGAFLLTNTELSINSISQLCGLIDANYFSRLFKKYYSITPSTFRKKHLYQQ